jgi:transposase
MKKRRIFSRDYKLAAIKKVLDKGLSVTEVARDLRIRDTLIHNWKRAFEADGTFASEVAGSSTVDAELKRLREENRQPKMERDILKKATAFFARENN